ncbi:hypothetical protein FB547_105270 [Variovorax beijingensis]|uniref:Uncharacterized protein n=2 Tax=Variovorax beijingensis TaxID=2496117 RepID=A0A561C3N0_9BURK|nr:hypothetical protein FB547_105270 [Variovorax beijingensis]
MLFVRRGSVLLGITPQLLWTTAFAMLVTVLHGRLFQWKVPLNFVPFSLIGLTLTIFLGYAAMAPPAPAYATPQLRIN